MLQKILTLAVSCLVVSNALQLEKCKDKEENTEPVFLNDEVDGLVKIEKDGGEAFLEDEVQEHLEEAIDAMIPVIAKGEEATED